MALPSGCFTVCRPKRKFERKFSAKDVGRVVCYAKQAGESDANIRAEIQKSGCLEAGEECNCDELAIAIGKILAAIAAILLIIRLVTPAGKLISLLLLAYKFAKGDRDALIDHQKRLKQLEKQGNLLEAEFDELQKVYTTAFKDSGVIIKP